MYMQQYAFHNGRNTPVEYHFKNRTVGINLAKYISKIKDAVADVSELRFTPDDLQFLREEGHFKHDYLEFFRDVSIKLRRCNNRRRRQR